MQLSCLLLAGLLALWAEPTAVSAEKRPEFCYYPKDPGPCKARMPRYFYNSQTKQCEHFFYGGCKGNKNNFETLEDCVLTCQRPRKVKPGICPTAPEDLVTICLAKCSSDWDCPGPQKCCDYACLRQCMKPV